MKRPRRTRLRTVGNAVGVGAVGAATTATLWLFGLQWPRALALAVPIAAVVVLVRVLTPNGLNSLAWPEPPLPSDPCAGWHHVALLSSSIHEATGDHDRFRSVIAPRLRKLAEARLREQNLRWDDPLSRERLGPDGYDLLAWPPDRPPDMARIREVISRVEALNPPIAPGTGSRRSVAARGAAR